MEVKFAPGFFNDMERLFSPKLRFRIPRLLRDIRWELKAAWQRVFRGYDDSMLWDFEHFVTEKALIAIPHYLNHGHLEYDKKKLRTILRGFKAAKAISERDYPEEWLKLDKKVFNRKIKAWMNSKRKTFEKGMDAFKEYYFGLWD